MNNLIIFDFRSNLCAMATMGMTGSIGGCGAASASLFRLRNSAKKKTRNDKNGFRVSCVCSSSAVADPYKTLKIQPGASESEVRKAFRQLALKVRHCYLL